MNVKIVVQALVLLTIGLKLGDYGMEENNSIHIQWIDGKEMFAVWDEADMILGYYDTRQEAEDAFAEYCKEIFPDG